MNSVNLIGRLTRNPELRTTKTGKSVCSFSIAINHGFKENKTVSYIDCEFWSSTAEYVSNYLKKGNLVSISGELRQDRWQDKDGRNQSKIKILALQVNGLESKKDDFGSVTNNSPAVSELNPFDEEIAF